MKTFLAAFSLVAFSLQLSAEQQYDYVLLGSECKMLIAYTVIADESLKVADGDTTMLFCKRNSNELACDVTHKEELSKVEPRTYTIEMDSPPILFFRATNGSETAFVNTIENAGSYSSRLVGENFMGHKVCSVMFFTYDQFKMLSENGEN